MKTGLKLRYNTSSAKKELFTPIKFNFKTIKLDKGKKKMVELYNWVDYTKIFIIAQIIIIAIWDILAFWKGGRDATITHVLRGWAQNSPIIVLAIGVLIGHVFWKD